jgi:signal transduction histidine kinase
MNARLRSLASWLSRQRRSFGIVFFVLGLLVVSRVVEYATLKYYTDNWERVVEARGAEQLAAVKREFNTLQRKTRRIAAELARHDDVIGYLMHRAPDASLVFERVSRVSRSQDVGAEVYDAEGNLVAWQGRSGVVNQREIHSALQGVLTSYVTRGPIFSQLFVISPVRVEGKIIGAVLIRQTIEVNYPLSNKFITRAGLAEQLTRDLGVEVEITYGAQAEPRKDGRYISAELRGIDERKLGIVNILRASRSSYLELVAERFRQINRLILLIVLLAAGIQSQRALTTMRSTLWKSIAVTLLIWLGRYALLWLDIPSVFLHLGIFDPSLFASKFGGGLAKSIGEMTLTTLSLLTNVVVVARFHMHSAPPLQEQRNVLPLTLRFLLVCAATALVFLLLRGYAAVIRSAVFDSTLRYNDPRVIVPSLELGVMMFNLAVIGFCLIVVTVALTRFILQLFAGMRPGWVSWGVGLVVFGIASFVFDLVQESPLVSIPFRLSFGIMLLLVVFVLSKRAVQRVTLGTAVLILAMSAAVFYQLLDEVIREKDRERIEVFAREVVRPADAWLKFVVEDALQNCVTDETFDILLNGDEEELERLAFTCWAKSLAAKQGYNCSFAIVNPEGEDLSRFAIGEQSSGMDEAVAAAFRSKAKEVEVRVAGSGSETVRMYSGVMPIVVSGELLGYGVVVVAASQQSLFRGEAPTVFRAVSQENIESFYRPIIVSEHRSGSAVPAGDAALPIGYQLPDEVLQRFADSTTTSFWYRETIAGKQYETFFARGTPASGRIVALRLEELDVAWHFFAIVRTLVYYAIVLFGAVAILLLIRWLRGNPYRLTFRDRLLLALLVTAAVPVIVISNYTHMYARERLVETLSERLDQETAEVENNLTQSLAADSAGDYTAAIADVLAAKIRADFNLYSGNMLRLSSRKELYDSGILDRRLSGSAYASIFVQGKRFHVETENIGLYRYAVGYRPVTDSTGRITGVVAVPALYRQDKIDEEVARTNALLFGVAAVLVIMILLIATTFANRIAAPIHKLTEATKRISLGDLDVKVNARADGEIGELIQSFERMTKDLKRSRENLVQFERELAWKEMAKQVAHEIKNPLTPMKLALQHLRQTYRDKVENFDEIFEEVSQMVIRQVDALGRIASEFSSFARMPNAKLERCSVNDILREAIGLFEQDRAVKFEARLEPQLPPILADREELRRAFINIIRNGVQAMENQGRMDLTTVKHEHDIEIRIRDSGSGIPDEIKGKLFQPNFSTKTDGMGLGLAIVKKTIEDLRGTIAIESVLHEGTTVVIHIPFEPA